jgi:hypothetical protein
VPDSLQIDLPDADECNAVRIPDAPPASIEVEQGVSRDEAAQLSDLLALDAEAIAARILECIPPAKADAIARAIDRRLLTWCAGMFDAGLPIVTGGSGRRRWPELAGGTGK